MPQSKAARRYAKALYSLAEAEGRTDAVRTDLRALADLLAMTPDLRSFVGNFTLPAARRLEILSSLFQDGPGRVDPLLFRFLKLLEEKKRTVLLGEIAGAFESLYERARGVLPVVITSSAPLSAAQITHLCDQLKKKLAQREIKATQRVDASLLGGFTVQVGDKVYDFSLETQLQLLKEKLAFA